MFDNKITEIQQVDGLYEISTSSFTDNRGSIRTVSNNHQSDLKISHIKITKSVQNSFRGLHGDHKTIKVVRCIHGLIRQFVFDARNDSPTFGNLYETELSGSDERQLVIPKGCLNGFLTLSGMSIYLYGLAYDGNYIDSDKQLTLAWNDERIKLDLPDDVIVQEKDKHSNI